MTSQQKFDHWAGLAANNQAINDEKGELSGDDPRAEFFEAIAQHFTGVRGFKNHLCDGEVLGEMVDKQVRQFITRGEDDDGLVSGRSVQYCFLKVPHQAKAVMLTRDKRTKRRSNFTKNTYPMK